MKTYYYSINNKQIGPVSFEELRGKIKPDTKIWFEGLSDWKKASEIPELNDLYIKSTQNGKIPPPLKKRKRFWIWIFIISVLFLISSLYILEKRAQARVDKFYYEESLKAKIRVENEKNEVRYNLWDYVSVKHFGVTVHSFGGIDPFKISIKNTSNYIFEKVIVRIDYIKANGDIYKQELVSTDYLGPYKNEVTLNAPSSDRGVKVRAYIVYIKSSELNLEYSEL